jgi:hypothetical protein
MVWLLFQIHLQVAKVQFSVADHPRLKSYPDRVELLPQLEGVFLHQDVIDAVEANATPRLINVMRFVKPVTK